MAGIYDYSETPASNTTLQGIFVGSDMARADVDNALRQLMAHAKTKALENISVYDFGAAGNGTSDDATPIQNAIDFVAETQGGGRVSLVNGKTYRCTVAPDIKDDVTLDLNGGKLLLALSGSNDTGVRLRNRSQLINGEVEVQSTGTPGSQAGIHSPVTIGPLASLGGTVASPSVYEGVSGWVLRNLKLSTNKYFDNGSGVMVGGVGVQINGGANNGLIENIEIPDSAYMFGGILADWGLLGSLSVTATQAAQDANKTAFNAGTAYTTHPHNIIIRNIRIGNLSNAANGVDTGSHGVRLSGVYNVTVENVRIKSCTYMAFRHTSGDLGFEFAPAAIKHLACKNIAFRNCAVENGSTAYLVYSDTYADNIGTAQAAGYTPLMDPLHDGTVTFERIVGKGPNSSSANYGFRIIQQRGGVIRDCDASYYKQGLNVDEKVYSLVVERFHAHFNREHGVYIHHPTNKPEDVRLIDCRAHDNGQDSGFSGPAGIAVQGSKRTLVLGARVGREGANDPTQAYGVRIVTAAEDVTLENCYAHSAKATTGVGFSLLSGTEFNKIRLFSACSANTSYTPTIVDGVVAIPVALEPSTGGTLLITYRAASGASLTGLALNRGDKIVYSDLTAGSSWGVACTTAGTVGTDAVTKSLGSLAA